MLKACQQNVRALQFSYLVTSENFWFSCVLRAYKIGKLAIEGLILNEILTTTKSQHFHFIPPENNRKLEIFWCFQRV